MSVKGYYIKDFGGIDQSKDPGRISEENSPDACNMDTTDGNLAVGKGYVKHMPEPVPGKEPIRRMYIWRGLVSYRYVVVAGNVVYGYNDFDETPAWRAIYTYEEIEGDPFYGTRWDFLETKIGDTDYLIIANGERQLIKWDGESETAELFGSEEKVSNLPVNYLAMHYSRLFSAGDPDHPSRLYWSCPPGTNSDDETRTIEDWSRDGASANTSGGHAEVGNTSNDPITGLCALSNQLIIFKRSSIYRLLGDRPSNYQIYQVYAETEEMSDESITLYGDIPFWLTKNGLYYFDGQTAQRMVNAQNVREILKGSKIQFSKGAKNNDKLYFTIRQNDADTENAMIIYDVPNRTYMLRNGFTVSDIFATGGTLYLINEKRYVYRWDEGDTYDGDLIEAYWNTPLTDLDSKFTIKTIRELYFRGEGDIILIDAKVGKNIKEYRYFMPEEIEDVQEVPLKNEGRVFSFKFHNEQGSRFTIRGGVQLRYEVENRTT